MDAMQDDTDPTTESGIQSDVVNGVQLNSLPVNRPSEGLQHDSKSDTLDSDDIRNEDSNVDDENDQASTKRTLARWTHPERVKLAEILNTIRDAQTQMTGTAPRLSDPSLFDQAALLMRDHFETPRTGKGCKSHWTRYRDSNKDTYIFLPKAVIDEAKKANRKSAGGAAPRPREMVLHENEASEGNEEENATPDPVKRRKSQPSKRAKVTHNLPQM